MDLFDINDIIMALVVCFSSIFVFLFNYRHDNTTIGAINKNDGEEGHNFRLIAFDLFINIGMAFTGYIMILITFASVPQLQQYAGFKYPFAYLFSLTANISIPIVLKWFSEQLSKKIVKLK